MQKRIFSLIIIILSFSFLNVKASDMSDSDFGSGKGLMNRRGSSLRKYRQKHYRTLPKWWYKYPYEKANFIWVSYSKNKKLVRKTYNAVINHSRYYGSKHFNKALAFYRKGAKYVNSGNFKYSIGYSHLARRRLYAALWRSGNRHMLPRRYRHKIPSSKEFKRIEYSVDAKANKKDMEDRRERARRRLMGGGDKKENVNIELDKDIKEINPGR